jgi:hypothetical protein
MKRKLIVAVVMLCSALAKIPAQPVLQTLASNGPPANRLNIVVLSEGYTSNRMETFLADSTNALNALLEHQPYKEYRAFFNGFAIWVPSAQSGSDHPSYGQSRNTYFNSTYDAADRIITIPPDATGQGKVDALLRSLLPEYDLAILLVNDRTPGGSDGFGKTAISSTAVSSVEILTHETGHVLAGLGDEYDTPYPGFPDIEEPNTTRATALEQIKWKAWIAANTPLPTPATGAFSGVVGLFEGAHYHTKGWYRPQLDCAMRSQGTPFCEVCSEALILSVYREVRPVDAVIPPSTNISVAANDSLAFGLSLVEPATLAHQVQWFADGAALANATNRDLSLPPGSLGPGPHLISARVADKTPAVRTDPDSLLSQTITWSVSVNAVQAELRLDSIALLPGERVRFRVIGTAPGGFAIQQSSDLGSWSGIVTNTLAGGEYWHTNNAAEGEDGLFFRAVTPPR